MSKEHVVPRWVSKIIVPHFGVSRPVMIRQSSAESKTVRDIAGAKVINVVMKRVCKVCNETWMEKELETPCRKVLPSMLRGQETVLDDTAQRVLAGWAAKTAMVGRYAHNPPGEIEPYWLEHIYRHHLPPPTWYVWVTAYRGKRYVYYDARGFSLPDRLVKKVDGVVMSLLIGHVVFKVLGIPRGVTPSYPAGDILFRLWPIAGKTLTWPPKKATLTDESLRGFVVMWGRGPGDPLPKLQEFR
jgi:hypothetical protein